MENERELAERVLTRPTPPKGTTLMPFTTEEQLIKDVAFKWQNATNIIMIEHDVGHAPVMHTRQIRGPTLTRSYTTTYYAKKWNRQPTISNEREYLSFCVVWAFIDGCYAYVKPMPITTTGAI
jgi:hypothetical protein